MGVFVLGLALFPAAEAALDVRLEEMAYATARAALDDAGVTRRQIDSLTIGACDELDGRPISSMLMTAPAGGYGVDEIKVTDSGASALALAYARFLALESQLGLVVSWCKCSKTDVESVMRFRGDPFYTRPLGIGAVAADALFAQAVREEFDISDDEVTSRVVNAYARAAGNPRSISRPVPTPNAIAKSPYEALPLREGQRAPYSDGAVALVFATDGFLKANPHARPLARLAGVGWATDSYRLDGQRLRSMASARSAWTSALRQAGLKSAADFDVVELEAQTGFHEAAYHRAFAIGKAQAVSPSGGCFAQNPLFATGLVNAAEAVLQVAGRAGPIQQPKVGWAAAHGNHGYAQQGNVVMAFEACGGAQ
jgi:hypothetical protein